MAEHEKKHEEGESHEGSHGGGGHAGGAHGGGGHGEHEESGAPEWLISFADNVMLIMAFFVIMLAMNMKKDTTGGIGGEGKMGGPPTSDMLDFVISMREGFNNPVDMRGTNAGEAALRDRIREKSRGSSDRSRQTEEPGKGKESAAIRETALSTLGGTIRFDDDSTALSTQQKQAAERIARNLQGQRYIIEVRGHASPSETHRQPQRGFSLSHARAVAVAEVLVSSGLKWEQIRIVACGDNERKAGREYDRDLDRQNQRVNVTPTSEPAPDYNAAADSSPRPAPAPE